MGARLSRREVVPQNDRSRSGLYKYHATDDGNYFSSHFRLGHRRYETGDPEYFLFGDMTDLNFLSRKPVQYPYQTPKKNDALNALQLYVNVHRDSVRFTKSTRNEDEYIVTFEFNSDVDCRVSLISSLPDSVDLGDLRDLQGSGLTRSSYHNFNRGSEVKFTGSDIPQYPGEMNEDDLTYNPENEHDTFPLAILIETSDVCEYQSQLTMCTVEKSSDGGYNLKVARQKIWVNQVEYLLHEMYGLENKSRRKERTTAGNNSGGEREEEKEEEEEEEDDEEEDLGAECVVCITDVRDTLLLPCRHLCLCASCAASLRYQSNNCPICRTPFKALLQVTALQPLNPELQLDEDEITGKPRYETPGYEKMPLLEALNGYRLKLPCEAEEEEEEEEEVEVPVANEEEGEEEREEGGEAGEQIRNGSASAATALSRASTTDTVISVEEELEIEALAKKPLATPTSSTHSPSGYHQKTHGHVQIDLDQGNNIPGFVPTPEVEYRGGGGKGGVSVVSVVVEERESEREREESFHGSVSQSSSSSSSTSSDTSTKELLTKH